VTLCNDLRGGLDMDDLNIDWYVKEAEKLVLALQE